MSGKGISADTVRQAAKNLKHRDMLNQVMSDEEKDDRNFLRIIFGMVQVFPCFLMGTGMLYWYKELGFSVTSIYIISIPVSVAAMFIGQILLFNIALMRHVNRVQGKINNQR